MQMMVGVKKTHVAIGAVLVVKNTAVEFDLGNQEKCVRNAKVSSHTV
jgi:hypothetical protein